MARREFSNKVKLQAWNRCDGKCEGCGIPLTGANRPEYDHTTPCGLGGGNDLGNCKVLGSKCCHQTKTTERDRPMIDKAERLRKKHLGIIRPKGNMRSRGFK